MDVCGEKCLPREGAPRHTCTLRATVLCGVAQELQGEPCGALRWVGGCVVRVWRIKELSLIAVPGSAGIKKQESSQLKVWGRK